MTTVSASSRTLEGVDRDMSAVAAKLRGIITSRARGRWDRLRAVEVDAEGLYQSRVAEASRLRDQAQERDEHAAHYENWETRANGQLTKEHRAEVAEARRQAKDSREQASALISKPVERGYGTHRFGLLAESVFAGQVKFAQDAYAKKPKPAEDPKHYRPDNGWQLLMPTIIVEDFDPAKIPQSPDAIEAALAKHMEGDEALHGTRHAIAVAECARADVEAKVKAELATLFKGRAPDYDRCFRVTTDSSGRRSPFGVHWPRHMTRAADDAIDVAGLLLWAMRDQLVAKVMEGLAALPDPKTGLPFAERAKRIAEIDGMLRSREMTQAAMLWRLIDAGRNVSFPAKMAPEAVLGISITYESGDFG